MTDVTLSDKHLNIILRWQAPVGKAIAFAPVMPNVDDCVPGQQGALGIAVANEQGYTPVSPKWARFDSYEAAEKEADRINEKLGIEQEFIIAILASSMGGMPFDYEEHIVKVQRPLNRPDGPCLVYGEERMEPQMVDFEDLPFRVRERMGDQTKAYFNAKYVPPFGWYILDRVEDQDW